VMQQLREQLQRMAAQCRRVTVIALLGVSCAAVQAQSPAVAKSGPYRITGRVVNAATGEPVRRATVGALAEGDNHIVATALSDDEGRFSLDHMPAGKFPLTASKRGYRTGFYDEHEEFNSAIVTGPDQDTTNLTFKLAPGSVIRGVVTADGGDPVESANVMLFQHQRVSTAGDRVVQIDATVTDDSGAYEFSNLAAGEYIVAVSASPWYALHAHAGGIRAAANEASSPLDVAYPITFFDSTIDESSASPIVLSDGGHQEADINLHAVPALHLKVAAPLKQGGPIARPELRQIVFGVQVAAESAGFLDAMRTGNVEFEGVAPGHYELMQGDPPRISELDATASQDVDPGMGTLAVSVSGTLRSASGTPLPEIALVVLDPVEPSHGQNQMQTTARTGQFRFDAVAPGQWSLSIQGANQALPVVATSTEGASTAGNQITVRDRAVRVMATISSTLTHVRGVARKDGRGAAGVMVVLVPREPTAFRALIRRDQSDSDGSFELRDVPAGQYTVVAIEDGWKLDWTQRGVMSRYLPGGVPVTVTDRVGAQLRLDVPIPVQAR
jgi:hypothetical protein